MGITKSPTGQVCLPLCENLTHEALEPPLLPVRYFPPFHPPVRDLVSRLFSGQVSISFSKSQGWKAVVLTNPLKGSLPSQQVQHCALCLTLDWHFLHTVDSEGHFSSQAGLFHICGQATAWVFMRLLHLNQSSGPDHTPTIALFSFLDLALDSNMRRAAVGFPCLLVRLLTSCALVLL